MYAIQPYNIEPRLVGVRALPFPSAIGSRKLDTGCLRPAPESDLALRATRMLDDECVSLIVRGLSSGIQAALTDILSYDT